MESQAFLPAMYSLSPVDLIPPDDYEDDAPDEFSQRQARYARLGKRVDLEDIVEMVCCRLKDSVQLQAVIQDALECPPDPERPRLHITDAMRLAEDVLREVVGAIDEQISVLDAVEG